MAFTKKTIEIAIAKLEKEHQKLLQQLEKLEADFTAFSE